VKTFRERGAGFRKPLPFQPEAREILARRRTPGRGRSITSSQCFIKLVVIALGAEGGRRKGRPAKAKGGGAALRIKIEKSVEPCRPGVCVARGRLEPSPIKSKAAPLKRKYSAAQKGPSNDPGEEGVRTPFTRLRQKGKRKNYEAVCSLTPEKGGGGGDALLGSFLRRRLAFALVVNGGCERLPGSAPSG